MFGGAFVGLVIVAPTILRVRYGYDHGYGEGARSNLMGTSLGVAAGLLIELAIRIVSGRGR
jgi:hypothetical protein